MRGHLRFVSVDETLYPYQELIGTKQYNPLKPAKNRLLYRSLCNAEFAYIYFTLLYNGKPDEYTKYQINNLLRYNGHTGRTIFLDRYFTSITLIQLCLEKRISIVGTMQTDRKGIPQKVKDLNHCEEKPTKFCHLEDKKLLLVCYVDKKAYGKKNLIMLTAMHKTVRVTENQRKKPGMIVS